MAETFYKYTDNGLLILQLENGWQYLVDTTNRKLSPEALDQFFHGQYTVTPTEDAKKCYPYLEYSGTAYLKNGEMIMCSKSSNNNGVNEFMTCENHPAVALHPNNYYDFSKLAECTDVM